MTGLPLPDPFARLERRYMRTVIFGCLLSLATVGSAHAQYTDYTPRTNDEIALVNAEDQWCDAAIKRDKERLEEVFADDLIYLTACFHGIVNTDSTAT
jgi:hypothetical protein